jgi:hypothetical protein
MRISERTRSQPVSLGQALEMFKEQFLKRYPESQFLIDGEGYEDEDLDVNIYVEADEIKAGQFAAEVSVKVLQQTGYLILGFIHPLHEFPLNP